MNPDFLPQGLPPGHGHVLITEADMTPPLPRWQKDLFPEGPLGPWTWPALEGARERHRAALDALAAARESQDAEAEREALIETCAAVVDGVRAVRITTTSAKAAFGVAVEKVKASVPVNEEGYIEHADRDAARQIQREAREWVGPDAAAQRRCWQMGEADTFLPDGSGVVVAPLVAEAEAFREGLQAAGLEATVDEAEAPEGEREAEAAA